MISATYPLIFGIWVHQIVPDNKHDKRLGAETEGTLAKSVITFGIVDQLIEVRFSPCVLHFKIILTSLNVMLAIVSNGEQLIAEGMLKR